MVYFETKNPTLGKFWRVLQRKMLVHFMTIYCILRPLEIFWGHSVYFVAIWHFPPVLECCTMKNLATLPQQADDKCWSDTFLTMICFIAQKVTKMYDLFKVTYIYKFRPKLIHQIDPRSKTIYWRNVLTRSGSWLRNPGGRKATRSSWTRRRATERFRSRRDRF
jgi:hypothetical protein